MINVSIPNYFPISKEGCAKARFSVLIQPFGQKIMDCIYYVQGDRRWFNFPRKEIQKNGTKEYMPLVSYSDKNYLEQLREAILKLLPMENHGQEKNSGYPTQKAALQDNASPVWF